MRSPVLMGMKHCGKTSIGRMLAKVRSMPFIDLDTKMEKLAARKWGAPVSVREIFRDRGREAFQALETEGLQEIARDLAFSADAAVIALGGGTIENSDGLGALAGRGFFIYLEEDEDVLFRRISSGGLPPFLESEDPGKSFHRLYEKRTALYRLRADLVVSLRGLSISEGLAELLRHL